MTGTAILAPSNLGLRPPAPGREPGVWRAPDALVSMGLPRRLGIERITRLDRPVYRFDRDPISRVRNVEGIRAFSLALADVVQEAVSQDGFTLVLGGDCSVLLGSLLGLRRRGSSGLVFIDGHRDYQTPATSVTGGVAGMDLAIATGVGPPELADLAPSGPLVDPEAVAAVGFRDGHGGLDPSSGIRDAGIHLFDLAAVRTIGPADLGVELAGILPQHLDGVWVHVDVDVLSTEAMPAIDSPQPGGLSFEELRSLLRGLVRRLNVVGLQVTIYDPERDPSGAAGRKLVDCLVAALGDG